MKIRRGSGSAVFDVILMVLLVLFCLTIIYPFWDLIRTSVEAPLALKKLGFKLFNEKNSLLAYKYLLVDNTQLPKSYLITVARTVVGTVSSVLVTFSGAYALSKKELPGRGLITALFVFTMFFGGGLIPSYLLIRNLGLYDSFWVYIFPGIFGVYNMTIMRNVLMAMDPGTEESALMDGAGYMRTMLRIIIPLNMPVIMTIALWNAVGHWNAWFDSMIYTKSSNLMVLQMMIRRLMEAKAELVDNVSMYTPEEQAILNANNIQAATILLTIGPIVALYPFFQKYFVKGIMVGSLKG